MNDTSPYSHAKSNDVDVDSSDVFDPSTQGPLRQRIADAVRSVRDTTPLAQSFTNFVTINLVANAQLASGGSAAMSFLPDDMLDLATLAGASYVNVGTLLPFYPDALKNIAASFHAMGHRWVLDPVAAGIGKTRTAILASLRDDPPTIVRANASEILALHAMWRLGCDPDSDHIAGIDAAQETDRTTELAGEQATYRTTELPNDQTADQPGGRPAGVESVDTVDAARSAAIELARFLAAAAPDNRAAVAVSGETDLVTDGEHTYDLPGGSAMMTKITGAGCSLGGVMATYLAVSDPLTAALAASALFNRAAEAAQADSNGPGSFQAAFLDALWSRTAEQVAGSPIYSSRHRA